MKKLFTTAALLLSAGIAFAQQQYTNVKVLSIQVNKCPTERMNGARFDRDSSPDLFAVFSAHNEEVYVTNYYENCHKFPVTFDLVRPFKVENLSIPYTLNLMDYERIGDDELIQKVSGNLVFADYKDYPAEITLNYKDQAEVVLKLQWY
jgi:hypothetical protein